MTYKPLTIPLEVLERILKLAFLPFVSSSSSTDEWTEPTPPSSTSHLLLVSKAIRQICHPFFWRSITIAKPGDWISLFDFKEGLVVIGEEGRKRWELVEEVRINVEAVVPVSMGPRSDGSQTYLAHVHLPSFRRVPKVVFEHLLPSSGSNRPSWIAKEEERDALRLRLFLIEDLPRWNHPRADYRACADGSQESYEVEETEEERVRRVVASLEEYFDSMLYLDRRVFQHHIFSSFQPLHAVIAFEHWVQVGLEDYVTDGDFAPFNFACHLEFTTSSHQDHLDIISSRDFISSANVLFNVAGGFTASLVGLSSDDLVGMQQWVEEEGRTFANNNRWDSRWSWQREDGSMFFVEFSELWS